VSLLISGADVSQHRAGVSLKLAQLVDYCLALRQIVRQRRPAGVILALLVRQPEQG